MSGVTRMLRGLTLKGGIASSAGLLASLGVLIGEVSRPVQFLCEPRHQARELFRTLLPVPHEFLSTRCIVASLPLHQHGPLTL